MLAQLADLRFCALMSLRPYVRPNVPARPYVRALMSWAFLSAPLCRVSVPSTLTIGEIPL